MRENFRENLELAIRTGGTCTHSFLSLALVSSLPSLTSRLPFKPLVLYSIFIEGMIYYYY